MFTIFQKSFPFHLKKIGRTGIMDTHKPLFYSYSYSYLIKRPIAPSDTDPELLEKRIKNDIRKSKYDVENEKWTTNTDSMRNENIEKDNELYKKYGYSWFDADKIYNNRED